MTHTVRFQDALPIAIQFAEEHYDCLGKEPPVLIRDLYGKIRLFLHSEQTPQHKTLAESLTALLGNFSYSANVIFIYEQDFFNSKTITDSPDKILIPDTAQPIYLLDRQITGQDWLRQPIQEQRPPRATLFGIKGGVGRSTALAVWAWDLARHGKKVLVVDLDLESPGIGGILLPQGYLPDFGVVDWLVEEAVGQADGQLLYNMIATSPLAETSEGVIRVVTAAGGSEQDYIAKLSRVYMDVEQDRKQLDFAHRLAKMLQQLEAQEKPDIVLLDSRAGIHDIAAIAITRLTDIAFLFAINTPQTWQAYRYLFSHWQKWNVNLETFRENLKIVAGMVPELGRIDYLSRCKESAYTLFSDTIYEAAEGDEMDSFNYAINNTEAPHYPIEILWNITFQEFDPKNEEFFNINTKQLDACYGNFLVAATQLALGENTR